MAPAKPPADPYALALKWLATRELTEFQVRQRLRDRHVSPDIVEQIVTKLRDRGAVDDRRAALACARANALTKRHGRHRVMRELESIGIDRGLAKDAVTEVFEGIDEHSLIEQALSRRLGRRGPTIRDPGEYRRLFSFLIRQGFDAAAVTGLLRSRTRNGVRSDEE